MVLLYLYDSALLLAANEALLAPGRKGRWHALFGAQGFQVRGKEPLLPNPLLPHRPLYRFSWDTAGLTGPSEPWSAAHDRYAILAPSVWLMLAALFILIPMGLLSSLGSFAIVAGLVVFYANAMLALTLVWLKRVEYQVSGKRLAALAFESLSCPPFALNLVRHLSLGSQARADFATMVEQYLSGAERHAALAQMSARVESAIDVEEEGTPCAQSMNAFLQYLTRESEPCRAPSS
jgi:hypothetical protein